MSRTEELIGRLRQKPEHIRHRIVLGTSAGITALVGIIWVSVMTSSGAFALDTNTSKPASDGQTPSSDAFALSGTNVKSNFSQLAGAVSAVTGATTSDASLKIVDGETSSSFAQPTQQNANANNNSSATVIPF